MRRIKKLAVILSLILTVILAGGISVSAAMSPGESGTDVTNMQKSS